MTLIKRLTVAIFCILIPLGMMGQTIRSGEELISIETSGLSLIFKKDQNNNLIFMYFGKKINDKESLLLKRSYIKPDTKEEAMSSGYPAYGGRIYIEPALSVVHQDGSLTTELEVTGHQIKTENNNIQHTISLKDSHYDFYVDLIFNTFLQENIISQQVKIYNKEKGPVTLHNFYSFYLPLKSQEYYLTSFHGTWAKEMQIAEYKLTPGIKSIASRKGVRTAQSDNSSFIISLDQEAKLYEGEIIMGSLAWTGNFDLKFELDESNQLNILAGINPFTSEYKLDKGQIFTTPEMLFTYSNQGYNQASRNFHDWARKYSLNFNDEINEIVLNSWEGAYFKFDEQKIMKMIDDAAFLGIETFVLDDGWFGNKYPRDSDKMGLGDWQVNTKKLPNGIDHLARYATKKGLKFGIWIEPEMVNPESELAEKHPGWVIKSPYRDIPTLRNQWLLDLSNPEVQDFIVKTFDDVVALSKDISYIKWDANRHVESPGSEFLGKDEQSKIWISYTKGLYSIYERIRKKHPHIKIQLCSSGGGRLDYGALKYHNEFWASDNTDPYTRIKLQYSTSLFFPAKAIGSHVTISPNHQTGNQSSLKLRCDVAMMGRMGVELKPDDMNKEELDFLKNAINTYKEVRDIVQSGDLYQLWSPYQPGNWNAMSYITKNKNKALFFAFSLDFHERTILPNFKMKALEPQTKYKIKELNPVTKKGFWGDGQVFSGEYLMEIGLNINILKQGESLVLLLEKVE